MNGIMSFERKEIFAFKKKLYEKFEETSKNFESAHSKYEITIE